MNPDHEDERLAWALRWPERMAEVERLKDMASQPAFDRLTELARDDVDDVAVAALGALLDRGSEGILAIHRIWETGDDFVDDHLRNAFHAAEDSGMDVEGTIQEFQRESGDDALNSDLDSILGLYILTPAPPIAPPPSAAARVLGLDLDPGTDELHEHLVRMAEERQAEVQEVTGTSKDERVKLTLLGSRATELTIDPRAMRQTNAELADQILEALNAALAAQGQAAGARTMAQLASIGEVLERSRRQAEEQLAQVRDGLRQTAEARAAADELYRDRGTP